MSPDRLAALRRIAEAAQQNPQSHGYLAGFREAFDPPTVLALLARIEELEPEGKNASGDPSEEQEAAFQSQRQATIAELRATLKTARVAALTEAARLVCVDCEMETPREGDMHQHPGGWSDGKPVRGVRLPCEAARIWDAIRVAGGSP